MKIEIKLEDKRFCEGCLLIVKDDFYGDPISCQMDYDWSREYYYAKLNEIMNLKEYIAKKNFLHTYGYARFWRQVLVRPQECIDNHGE